MNRSDIPLFQNPQLDGKSKYLPGDKSVGFLLIHGFTATTVEVSRLAEFINGKGFTVLTPLLPGHGTDPADLNTKTLFDWINCVEDAYKILKNKHTKIIVGGESMGAVLSLYLAEMHPEISALLLYSLALQVSRLKYAIPLRLIKAFIPKNNYDDEMPWQGYTVYPLKAAFEFYKLQQLVKKSLSDIHSPVAIFHGHYDKTIDQTASEIIFRNLKSSVKQIFNMKNSGHVMLLDEEFSKIAEISWKFLTSKNIL